MRARDLMSATCLLAMLVGASCGNDPVESVLAPSEATFVTTVEVQDPGGQSKNAFAGGEPIRFVLGIRNLTDAPASTGSGTTKLFDFYVLPRDGNEPTWRWSSRQAFGDAPTKLEFAPGETKTFEVQWDQTDDAGVQVQPGSYEVQGSHEGEGPPPVDFSPTPFLSPPRPFRIVASGD